MEENKSLGTPETSGVGLVTDVATVAQAVLATASATQGGGAPRGLADLADADDSLALPRWTSAMAAARQPNAIAELLWRYHHTYGAGVLENEYPAEMPDYRLVAPESITKSCLVTTWELREDLDRFRSLTDDDEVSSSAYERVVWTVTGINPETGLTTLNRGGGAGPDDGIRPHRSFEAAEWKEAWAAGEVGLWAPQLGEVVLCYNSCSKATKSSPSIVQVVDYPQTVPDPCLKATDKVRVWHPRVGKVTVEPAWRLAPCCLPRNTRLLACSEIAGVTNGVITMLVEVEESFDAQLRLEDTRTGAGGVLVRPIINGIGQPPLELPWHVLQPLGRSVTSFCTLFNNKGLMDCYVIAPKDVEEWALPLVYTSCPSSLDRPYPTKASSASGTGLGSRSSSSSVSHQAANSQRLGSGATPQQHSSRAGSVASELRLGNPSPTSSATVARLQLRIPPPSPLKSGADSYDSSSAPSTTSSMRALELQAKLDEQERLRAQDRAKMKEQERLHALEKSKWEGQMRMLVEEQSRRDATRGPVRSTGGLRRQDGPERFAQQVSTRLPLGHEHSSSGPARRVEAERHSRVIATSDNVHPQSIRDMTTGDRARSSSQRVSSRPMQQAAAASETAAMLGVSPVHTSISKPAVHTVKEDYGAFCNRTLADYQEKGVRLDRDQLNSLWRREEQKRGLGNVVGGDWAFDVRPTERRVATGGAMGLQADMPPPAPRGLDNRVAATKETVDLVGDIGTDPRTTIQVGGVSQRAVANQQAITDQERELAYWKEQHASQSEAIAGLTQKVDMVQVAMEDKVKEVRDAERAARQIMGQELVKTMAQAREEKTSSNIPLPRRVVGNAGPGVVTLSSKVQGDVPLFRSDGNLQLPSGVAVGTDVTDDAVKYLALVRDFTYNTTKGGPPAPSHLYTVFTKGLDRIATGWLTSYMEKPGREDAELSASQVTEELWEQLKRDFVKRFPEDQRRARAVDACRRLRLAPGTRIRAFVEELTVLHKRSLTSIERAEPAVRMAGFMRLLCDILSLSATDAGSSAFSRRVGILTNVVRAKEKILQRTQSVDLDTDALGTLLEDKEEEFVNENYLESWESLLVAETEGRQQGKGRRHDILGGNAADTLSSPSSATDANVGMGSNATPGAPPGPNGQDVQRQTNQANQQLADVHSRINTLVSMMQQLQQQQQMQQQMQQAQQYMVPQQRQQWGAGVGGGGRGGQYVPGGGPTAWNQGPINGGMTGRGRGGAGRFNNRPYQQFGSRPGQGQVPVHVADMPDARRTGAGEVSAAANPVAMVAVTAAMVDELVSLGDAFDTFEFGDVVECCLACTDEVRGVSVSQLEARHLIAVCNAALVPPVCETQPQHKQQAAGAAQLAVNNVKRPVGVQLLKAFVTIERYSHAWTVGPWRTGNVQATRGFVLILKLL